MAVTNATVKMNFATIAEVEVGTAATKGYGAKFSAQGIMTNCAAGDAAHGIWRETGTTGQRKEVVLPGPIVPAKIGTGGAAAGAWLQQGADGLVAVTTGKQVAFAFDAAAAGDIVGVCFLPAGFADTDT